MGQSQKENDILERIVASLPKALPGEIWSGDDMAVFDLTAFDPRTISETKSETETYHIGKERPGGKNYLLFSSDCLVENVHFDKRFSSAEDIGYKALSVNISDIAAMGAIPYRAVVSVAAKSGGDIEAVMKGMAEAAAEYSCPITGGDLSAASQMFISVAVLAVSFHSPPVLRSGANPGDSLFVTGPLGAGYAGLRYLKEDPKCQNDAANRHRRPKARLEAGLAAKAAGAGAMMDLSDGILTDSNRLALASAVGVSIDYCPVHNLATEDEALQGGDDYELLFTAKDSDRVKEEFASRSLELPIEIGKCTKDPGLRLYKGRQMELSGFQHIFKD